MSDVRIVPPAGDGEEATRIAQKLIEAAGDNPHLVQTVVDGGGLGFLVPQEVADKADITGEKKKAQSAHDKKGGK